ncbi:MAG: hypothetical protein KGL72_04660, partial [Actinomycetales bacterium]|nr:hypothetical protein [Actinomycetales bacterium]
MNPLQQRSLALGLLLCLAAAFVLQHSDSTRADTQSVGPARLTLPVISPVTMVRGFQAPLT